MEHAVLNSVPVSRGGDISRCRHSFPGAIAHGDAEADMVHHGQVVDTVAKDIAVLCGHAKVICNPVDPGRLGAAGGYEFFKEPAAKVDGSEGIKIMGTFAAEKGRISGRIPDDHELFKEQVSVAKVPRYIAAIDFISITNHPDGR